ncbi:hypothetical protein PG593_10865 [Riemerella anatipestifer]|nr:hypothetical protein [Riemerella anatipestifer]
MQFFDIIADNGLGIAEGGAYQHLTSTKIPHFKDKQLFLKKQLTPLAAIPCCAIVLLN